MAYTTNTFSQIVNSIEGAITIWGYTTADALATVKGAAYFSDAVNKGVTAGDIVFVINTTTPVYAIYVFATAANAAAGTVTGVVAIT